MSSINLKNVSIYYKNKKEIVTALDDVTFSFYGGKINVLVGFSGSGKTSILNAISGSIMFDGDIFLNRRRYLPRRTGGESRFAASD